MNKKGILVIAIIVIVLMVMFVWLLKNRDKENVNNDVNTNNNEIIEESEVYKDNINEANINEEIYKEEIPLIQENENNEIYEQPIIENEYIEPIKEPIVENKPIEKIEEPIVEEDIWVLEVDKVEVEKWKKKHLPIILDFGSEYCGPCQQMYPSLVEVNNELKGKAIIKFADVWKNDGLTQGYNVSLIPTQILIDSNGNPYNPEEPSIMGVELVKDKNGKHIYTMHVGILTKEQMLTILKEMGLSE